MILETEELRLLPADPALAQQAADYYRRNRDFFAPIDPITADPIDTAEYQRDALSKAAALREQRAGYRFFIERKAQPGEIIGMIALNNVVWGAFRSAFVAYKLDARYLNCGYMTQALTRLTRFAFDDLHLHRLEANIMPRNLPSLRVAEKCGFDQEGLARAYLYIAGKWEDHIHMVRLNPDWQPEG